MYIKKTTAKLSRGGNKRVSMLRAEKLGENYASAKGTYISRIKLKFDKRTFCLRIQKNKQTK